MPRPMRSLIQTLRRPTRRLLAGPRASRRPALTLAVLAAVVLGTTRPAQGQAHPARIDTTSSVTAALLHPSLPAAQPLDHATEHSLYADTTAGPRYHNPGPLAGLRPYLALRGGASVDFDTGIENPYTNSSGFTVTDQKFDMDAGFFGGAALGTTFGSFRGEVEFTYRSNDIVNLRRTLNEPPRTGDYDSYNLAANLFYDHTIVPGRFDLYVGAGVGVARSELSLSRPLTLASGQSIQNQNTWSMTAQFMLGFKLDVSDTAAITIGYRGHLTDSTAFDALQLEESYVHNIEVGLLLQF